MDGFSGDLQQLLAERLARYPGGKAAPERTLLDILDATAAACPGATALDDGRTVLTYAELTMRVDSIARRLHADGVGLGDRVGVRVTSGTVDL